MPWRPKEIPWAASMPTGSGSRMLPREMVTWPWKSCNHLTLRVILQQVPRLYGRVWVWVQLVQQATFHDNQVDGSARARVLIVMHAQVVGSCPGAQKAGSTWGSQNYKRQPMAI